MTVFERIKKLAHMRGISLQKVAEDNDFSSNLIYRWKKTDPKGNDLINRFFISKSLIKPVFILYSVQHLCITLPYFRFLPSLLYTS